MSYNGFLIILITILCLIKSIQSELLFVIELFRHGARGPIYDYWDGNQQEQGQLTNVGMRQHYNLGYQLRKDYIQEKQFLSPSYNNKELLIFSTDVDRTIMSAQSQLFGLYPLGTGISITPNQQKNFLPPFKDIVAQQFENMDQNALPNKFQPFPIHTLCSKEDTILSNSCKMEVYTNSQQKQIQNNQNQWDYLTNKFRPLMNDISQMLGQQISTLQQLQQVYDTLISDLYQNRNLPKQLTEEMWKQLEFVSNYIQILFVSYGDYNKIANSDFLQFIIDEIDKKLYIQNNKLKWIMLSAHDTNIFKQLGPLNITDPICIVQKLENNSFSSLNCQDGPPYASTLIYEIYQDSPNQQPYIMIKYQGEYINLCEQRQPKCDYNQFKKRLQNNYIIANARQKCGLVDINVKENTNITNNSNTNSNKNSNSNNSDGKLVLFIIIFIESIVLVGVIIIFLIKSRTLQNALHLKGLGEKGQKFTELP